MKERKRVKFRYLWKKENRWNSDIWNLYSKIHYQFDLYFIRNMLFWAQSRFWLHCDIVLGMLVFILMGTKEENPGYTIWHQLDVTAWGVSFWNITTLYPCSPTFLFILKDVLQNRPGKTRVQPQTQACSALLLSLRRNKEC